MADEQKVFSDDDAKGFVQILDITQTFAQQISDRLMGIESYTDLKAYYNAGKSLAIKAENDLGNAAEQIENDSTYVDPCFSAGFYLNQIMWDINIVKNAENKLENIGSNELSNFFSDFRYDLHRYARFAGECMYNIKKKYNLD
jgi:hypothetical protein